ncbi:MAG TPA: BatD family protein [Clostridia bacterium]|nr:BatD family protein [Clostridia bacterium]
MIGRKTALLLVFITTMLFLPYLNAFAAETQFQLTIDNQNLEMGTSANLVLSMVNADNAKPGDIKGLDNFDVLSSNPTYSTQVINGNATSQTDINYTIMPKKTGDFTLEGSIKYEGKTYKTNKLTIKVVQAAKADETSGEKKDIFVKTHTSDQKIYFGQKVALTYELYTRYNIDGCNFTDKVSFNGFISKEVSQNKLSSNIVNIGGTQYAKYEIKKVFLSSVKPGEYSIPAYNLQVSVNTDNSFFGNTQTVYVQTEPIKLIVMPLPQKNKPADFSGIVGKLNVEAQYDKQKINAGDSLTLHVKASGNCNLDDLTKIVKKGVPGFTVYETEKKFEENLDNNQYTAQKEFDVILVPEKSGDIKIAPISIPYFNPQSGNYEEAEIPGADITVNGKLQQGSTLGTQTDLPIETVKINQVSYNTENSGKYITLKFKKSGLYLIGAVLIILAALGVLLVWILKLSNKQDKKLKEMLRELEKTDDKRDLYNLFNEMIKYSLNISLKASSRETIASQLAACGLTEPVLEIVDLMENGKDLGIQELKEKIRKVCIKLMRMIPNNNPNSPHSKVGL